MSAKKKTQAKDNTNRNLIIILFTVLGVFIFMLFISGVINIPLPNLEKEKKTSDTKGLYLGNVGKETGNKSKTTTKDSEEFKEKVAGKEKLIFSEYDKLEKFVLSKGMKLNFSFNKYLAEYEKSTDDNDFFLSWYDKFEEDNLSIADPIETDSKGAEDRLSEILAVSEEQYKNSDELIEKYGVDRPELDELYVGYVKILKFTIDNSLHTEMLFNEYVEIFASQKDKLTVDNKAEVFNEANYKKFKIE